ncbi:MAG: serine/threonine-protein kinase [Eubacterium sp.]
MGGYRKADEYFKKELDRVVNEIRVFAMISEKDNHHIVSYYENDVEKSGKYKYSIYILMEIMTPLDKWLHENNLTVSEAIDISLEVAKGLKVCHQNNIMHRDIKLNNIFVSKDGKFKLGDFGVSKRLDTLTRSHTIKGTPHYIAPEIYVKNEKYNKQADIYSLGVLMYYLFNKRRYPFYPNTRWCTKKRMRTGHFIKECSMKKWKPQYVLQGMLQT